MHLYIQSFILKTFKQCVYHEPTQCLLLAGICEFLGVHEDMHYLLIFTSPGFGTRLGGKSEFFKCLLDP